MTIRYSHSKRRRHLDVWQQNGLPKKHYCHLHDLNIATFYYWLKHHQDDVVNVPSAFIPARQVVPENNGSDAVTLDLPNGCSVSCLPVELQARDAGLFPMLTPQPMPREMTDEIGEAIANEANCCGEIVLSIYEAALDAEPCR